MLINRGVPNTHAHTHTDRLIKYIYKTYFKRFKYYFESTHTHLYVTLSSISIDSKRIYSLKIIKNILYEILKLKETKIIFF